jgi:4-hydroxy-2-oxoheptanedioate aldolase
MSTPYPSLAERIGNADTVYGLIVKMPAPALVELAGHTGFDLVVVDTEHGIADDATLEHHLRAADSAGIPALVRVGSNQPLLMLRALDAGATGVIVPHVSNAEDARAAVAAAHYPPAGTRGLAVSTRAGHHATVSLQAHLADAAANTVVVAQAEDTEAVQHSADIAATPGLNAVWIGPSDLSLSLGLPGQMDHPEVVAAIDHIAHKVVASDGCALCVLVDTPEQAAEWSAQGARMVLFNSTAILSRELANTLTGVRGGNAVRAVSPRRNADAPIRSTGERAGQASPAT